MTGNYVDKDFSEEFAIQKAQQFLENNANFKGLNNTRNNLKYIDPENTNLFPMEVSMRQSRNKSKVSKLNTNQTSQKLKINLLHKKPQSPVKNDQAFNNSYLNCYFKIQEERKQNKKGVA